MSDGESPLTATTDGDRLVVTGEIDALTAPELAAHLDPLPGSGDIVVDVSGVQFIDSSGLRVVIDAHQRAESAGRRLVLEQPSASVVKLLEITGLVDHLHIAPH